jgi:hypothetical protein
MTIEQKRLTPRGGPVTESINLRYRTPRRLILIVACSKK